MDAFTWILEDIVMPRRPAPAGLGDARRICVRPDGPLKPFGGRVLDRDAISLAALDHGFCHGDLALPIVVAPARDVGREWRRRIARAIDPPEAGDVLDVVEAGDELRLLELDPLSGADLHACDASALVRAIETL